MKIFVIGSGGREHCLIWKIAQSPLVDTIYCAPGNAGITRLAECVDIKADDISGLLQFAQEKAIDLTIVGPEIPLSLGIVNLFQQHHIPIFGPSREATEIESSKVFAKYMMQKYEIPTARYAVFEDQKQALSYINTQSLPLVLKVDGLAAGKGVFIVQTLQEAEQIIGQVMTEKQFGDAGNRIVVEEFLEGEEVSMLVFTDGTHYIPMVSSQDHKKIFENDRGPNTGGMGAYSPVPFFQKKERDYVEKHIITPIISGMKKEGRLFRGILYTGLILTEKGPKVLEFNARFGDPETQVILPRLKTDLIKIIKAIIGGYLNKIQVQWYDNASVCVVMASEGYPGHYERGFVIKGLDKAAQYNDLAVFHAGTRQKEGQIYSAGGRVLSVTAWSNELRNSIKKAYSGIQEIYFKNDYYRKDIGQKGLR